MDDFEPISTRPAKMNRADRKALENLRERGRHYFVTSPHEPEDTVVAHTSNLNPAILGYVGFRAKPGGILPQLEIAAGAVDPAMSDADGDAVLITLLRALKSGFDEVRRGYILARIASDDASARRLLEADGWEPTAYREDRSWIPYAWYAEKQFQVQNVRKGHAQDAGQTDTPA